MTSREQEIRDGVDYLFGGSFVWNDDVPDDPYRDLDREHGWFLRVRRPPVIVRFDGVYGDSSGTLVGYAKGYGEIYEYPFFVPLGSWRYMGSLEEQLDAELEESGLSPEIVSGIERHVWELYKASCDDAYNEWDGTGYPEPTRG